MKNGLWPTNFLPLVSNLVEALSWGPWAKICLWIYMNNYPSSLPPHLPWWERRRCTGFTWAFKDEDGSQKVTAQDEKKIIWGSCTKTMFLLQGAYNLVPIQYIAQREQSARMRSTWHHRQSGDMPYAPWPSPDLLFTWNHSLSIYLLTSWSNSKQVRQLQATGLY